MLCRPSIRMLMISVHAFFKGFLWIVKNKTQKILGKVSGLLSAFWFSIFLSLCTSK